jgi:hypothetical protein
MRSKIAIGATITSFICITGIHAGYLLGDPAAECWLTDLTTNVQVYSTSGCPSSINLRWTDTGLETLTEGEPMIVEYHLSTTLDVVPDSNHHEIRHANLHCCRTSLGACVPNIAIATGLVTQNPVNRGNFTDSGREFAELLKLQEGDWTVIAHTRFVSGHTLYDVAIGTRKIVLPVVNIIFIEEAEKKGLIFLALFCAVLCLVTLAVLVWNRRKKVIRYSTASFCMIMISGCALGATSAIPFAYVNEVSCGLRPTMLMLSFTMTYVPLILKTYRVFRLFHNGKITLVNIPDSQLTKVFLGFILIDIVIISCWLGIDAAKPIPTMTLHHGKLSTSEMRCNSEYNTIIMTSVVVYKSCILVVGIFFAYLTRNVPSLFNESTHIAQVFKSLVLAVVAGVTIIFFIVDQPAVIYAIETLVTCFVSLATAFQLFLPKFYLIYTVDEEDIQGFEDRSSPDKDRSMSRSRKIGPGTGGRSPSLTTVDDKCFNGLKVTQKQLKLFVNEGVIPKELVEMLSKIKHEADRLITRSGMGYKVHPGDFHSLKASITTFSDLSSSIEYHGVLGLVDMMKEELQ